MLNDIRKASSSDAISAVVNHFQSFHERYANATNDHSNLPKAFNIVGNALLRLKTPEAARLAGRLAATALDHDPNHEHSWVLKATAAAALGQWDVAESVLLRARERLPEKAHIRNTLAGMLADWGRAGEAEALYRETMDRIPSDKAAPTALAKLLADHGEAAKAEAVYRAFMKNHPDDDVAPTALARLLADHGREGEAEALYRETMERFPENPVCRNDLGLMLIRLGRRDEAEPLLKELEALGPKAAKEAAILRAHLDGKVGEKQTPPAAALPVTRPADAVGRALWAKFALALPGRVKGLLLMTADEAEALRAEAERLLDEALRRDPNNPVVRLVARRYGRIDAASAPTDLEARRVAGKDYALRLELAQAGPDEDPFAWLFDDFPDAHRRALTATAWLRRSPWADGHPMAEDAAEHLNRWLARNLPDTAPGGIAALHAKLGASLRKADAVGAHLDTFLEAFDRIPQETLNDLIDIALLGLVLDAMSMADFAEEAAHETV